MNEIEPGAAADAAQAARTQGHRAGEATGLEDLAAVVDRARGAWARRKISVIESDCPACRVDSPLALACGFRGHDFCAHAAELSRRARAKALEHNLRAGSVPAPFWRPILEGAVHATSASAAARRMVADEGKLAIFSGQAGGGKTFGMALAIGERGGFFCAAAALDPFGKEANDLLDHCSDVPLLGLDDAGAGRSGSDVARARLEQLVCARWDAGRATIITTNLQPAAFWPLYGGPLGRIADRLSSDAIGWVRCLEESHRTGGAR